MNLVGATFKPVTAPKVIDDVISQVCELRGIPLSELLGTSRLRRVVQARQEVAWIARNLLKMSLLEIGDALRRDHSSIIGSLASIKSRMQSQDYAMEIAVIALRIHAPVVPCEVENIYRELGCEPPHKVLEKRQTIEVPPLEDIALQDVDADACLRLWRVVLEKTLCAALGCGSNYFPRKEAERWIGSEDFHMVCDLAGRDGDAILRRYTYQKKIQAGEV